MTRKYRNRRWTKRGAYIERHGKDSYSYVSEHGFRWQLPYMTDRERNNGLLHGTLCDVTNSQDYKNLICEGV